MRPTPSSLPHPTALAALLLLLGCAGPDLGPSRGTQGPWWVANSQLSAAVGAVKDTREHHAQAQAPRPVHFRAAGEREALLQAAGRALRERGHALRARLGPEPLHTARRDTGLEYGTVGSRPALLTRSFALEVEPAPAATADAPRCSLTLRIEVERCTRASLGEPELSRACEPLRELPPELQQELDSLGAELQAALVPSASAAR